MKEAHITTSHSHPVDCVHVRPDEFVFMLIHHGGHIKSIKLVQEKDGTVILVIDEECKIMSWDQYCNKNKGKEIDQHADSE